MTYKKADKSPAALCAALVAANSAAVYARRPSTTNNDNADRQQPEPQPEQRNMRPEMSRNPQAAAVAAVAAVAAHSHRQQNQPQQQPRHSTASQKQEQQEQSATETQPAAAPMRTIACSLPSSRRQQSSSVLAIVVVCLSLIASFSAQIPAVAALACYETVNGKTTIVQNDSWTYCALVPATIVGNELVNGSQFGLGPDNDMMSMYNSAFSMSQEEYRILTVCIYERYDFSRFLTIKPDLAVEFAFRCVCNYDLCNSEPTFSAYLSAIKSDSFARR